jgi:L-aminopeptidase/D-esterase-like protein
VSAGPSRSLAAVGDVSVIHAEAGFSAVLPYPRSIGRRKVWGGCRIRGRVGEVTGLHVLRDFGTLSSPIVLCPLPWTGAIYDALIEEGFRRDTNLSIDAGWPPIVLGIFHPAPPPAAAAPRPEAVRQALAGAGSTSPAAAGVILPWHAAGARAGWGTASVAVEAAGAVAVFAAVCGAPKGDEAGVAPVSVLVVAADAPLGPGALSALAGQALEGAALAGLSGGGAGLAALAFTTAQAVSGAFDPRTRRISRREIAAPQQGALGDAARDSARLAGLRALET